MHPRLAPRLEPNAFWILRIIHPCGGGPERCGWNRVTAHVMGQQWVSGPRSSLNHCPYYEDSLIPAAGCQCGTEAVGGGRVLCPQACGYWGIADPTLPSRRHVPRKAYSVAFQLSSSYFCRRSLRVVGSWSPLLAEPTASAFSCSRSNRLWLDILIRCTWLAATARRPLSPVCNEYEDNPHKCWVRAAHAQVVGKAISRGFCGNSKKLVGLCRGQHPSPWWLTCVDRVNISRLIEPPAFVRDPRKMATHRWVAGVRPHTGDGNHHRRAQVPCDRCRAEHEQNRCVPHTRAPAHTTGVLVDGHRWCDGHQLILELQTPDRCFHRHRTAGEELAAEQPPNPSGFSSGCAACPYAASPLRPVRVSVTPRDSAVREPPVWTSLPPWFACRGSTSSAVGTPWCWTPPRSALGLDRVPARCPGPLSVFKPLCYQESRPGADFDKTQTLWLQRGGHRVAHLRTNHPQHTRMPGVGPCLMACPCRRKHPTHVCPHQPFGSQQERASPS